MELGIGILCLLLSPFPLSSFPGSPGLQAPHAEADSRLLFQPRLSGGPFGPRPPRGRRWPPSPSWYLCSRLWWLDLVLNNKLLKECEQRVSRALAHARPPFRANPNILSAAAAPLLVSELRVGPGSLWGTSQLSPVHLKSCQPAASSFPCTSFLSHPPATALLEITFPSRVPLVS